MAQAPYTVRFGGGPITSGVDTTLYTAPSSYQSVLRDLVIYNAGTESGHFWVWVVAGTTSLYVVSQQLDAPLVLHWEGRQVLEPGDTLHVTGQQPGTVLVTGYQLVVPSTSPQS